MKRFNQHQINENETIDSMGHDMQLSPKRKKQLESDKGVFEDFPTQMWLDYTPKPNSSDYVKRELKTLQSYEQYRQGKEVEFMDMVDTKVMKPYRDYFKKHNLDMKLIDEVKVLKDNLAPIVLQLKLHYNRPRPQKLANALQFMFQTNFVVHALKTAETPSYPSGHATEGRFVSLYLAEKIPFEHKGNIKKIGDDIGHSRQIGGVHYPTDTEFGHQLAGALYNHIKQKLGKPQGNLESFNSLVSILTEASVMQGKYKTGFQFLYNGKWGKLNALGYKSGDVFEVEDDKGLPVDIGKGDARKQLKAPDGKSITLAGTASSYGSYFTRLPDGNPTPSGEDWEALIAVAVNDKQEGAEWDRAEKFWANYGEDAIKVGELFKKQLGVKKLEQYGASSAKLNPKWKGKNTTPKTDLLGDGKKRKISLKKAGGSQLMSGKKEETISTFESAMGMMGESSPRKVKGVIDSLEKKMGEMNEKGTIGALEKLRDSGKPLTPAQKKSIEQMENLQFTAKELTAEMTSLFDDIEFKQYFCFEAATGTGKFAEPLAVANELVEFNPDKVIITKHLPMKKPKDAKVLAQTNKFYVSFKTGGGGSRPYLSMRSGNVKFAQIVKEELQNERIGMQLLHEGKIEQLNEFQMFSRLVQKVKNVSSTIKNQAKKILDAIMKRVKAVFKKIKELGKGMFNALLNFFGLEVQNVKITSSAKSFPLI
tara:strand:+ start:8083 stop:10200 length:2118 start_codon:yes stop_codon:yes gene_type:complete